MAEDTKTTKDERTRDEDRDTGTQARSQGEQAGGKVVADDAPRPEAPERREDEQLGEEVKSVSATAFDEPIGSHHVQTFANTPANPQPAPGLDPKLPREKRVRMEITDSDNPDPANPKVTHVHPEMVGDYVRAGWRQAAAV